MDNTNNVSTVVAGVLNWIVPGAGNIYIGQITKGVIFCIISVILWGVAFITCGLGSIIYLPYMVVMIIDAAKLADHINNGEIIDEWQFF